MGLNRKAFLVAAWAALLAILMAVMAPTFSHALAHQAGAGAGVIEVDICTASGIAMTHQMQVADDGSAPGHVASFEHCPFCQASAHMLFLPSPPVVLHVSAGAALRPALFYQSSSPLFAWTVAQPRGPPAT
ncbi:MULTISPECIES: DUF2946 family protein [unclassified Massilia]|uniref:DUF2946 family protein n=1 Tax=unclassified Massilia TaxID=2609279 RepID=UPI00177F98EA|nr:MULTISPECIES: DUF2946 family protein [unclassified Massilia]MBD8529791.1 DUF2946 family protein [Massilia sp. CFBP 13647]MBD8672197.1 DUF2946 family protein [Massilia sp. CFBP 13721]